MCPQRHKTFICFSLVYFCLMTIHNVRHHILQNPIWQNSCFSLYISNDSSIFRCLLKSCNINRHYTNLSEFIRKRSLNFFFISNCCRYCLLSCFCCLMVDWPQSFLFLCYIYLAFLHFFSSASLIQVCVCG